MRYRIDQPTEEEQQWAQSTQDMMVLSYAMAIPLGLILLWLGIRGKVMWLKVWSVGLILLGFVLLANHYFGFFLVD